MSPVDLTRVQREELQRELDRNRRWELRLPIYGGVALLIVAAIAVLRLVFFS
ncbi:hypothetical protein ACRAWC_00685 [Leifsonia sp. L25]|uniref:hypothetical protein n=1 Tax=Actinomycetes TaxID=1760 RepID=UPI003D686A31